MHEISIVAYYSCSRFFNIKKIVSYCEWSVRGWVGEVHRLECLKVADCLPFLLFFITSESKILNIKDRAPKWPKGR